MIAGIDVGGTKLRYVILEKKRVVSSKEIKTPNNKKQFEHIIRELLLDFRERGIEKVGIGVPGIISRKTLLHAPNLPSLGRIDFSTLTPRGLSVKVDNDARCFARSEMIFGQAKNASLLAFTLGTGVGRALIKNNKIAALRRFEHAEAWERDYQKLVTGSNSQLKEFLGGKLSAIISEIKPDAVIIGGGGLRKKGAFSLLKKELRKHGVKCPIHRSRFRQNSAAIGAAVLAAGK